MRKAMLSALVSTPGVKGSPLIYTGTVKQWSSNPRSKSGVVELVASYETYPAFSDSLCMTPLVAVPVMVESSERTTFAAETPRRLTKNIGGPNELFRFNIVSLSLLFLGPSLRNDLALVTFGNPVRNGYTNSRIPAGRSSCGGAFVAVGGWIGWFCQSLHCPIADSDQSRILINREF
jgi:hypothetical protein